MMKQEFEKMIGRSVNEEQWIAIETVYMYHPAISDNDGKNQMFALWTNGGQMMVIADMLGTAMEMERHERAISEATCEVNRLKAVRDDFIKRFEALRV